MSEPVLPQTLEEALAALAQRDALIAELSRKLEAALARIEELERKRK